MDRRAFVTGLGAVLAAALAVEAQQAGKMYRLGVLALGGQQQFKDHRIMQAFRGGLRDMGYVEGQNLSIEYRWADGQVERLDVLAAELVRLNVDVIFTAGALPPALAAKPATDAIPIIFEGVGRPIETGLVKTLARPGGNATGTTYFQRVLEPKHLELLKTAIPALSRVGVVLSPTLRTNSEYRTALLRELESAGRTLNLDVQYVEPNTAADLDEAVAAVASRRVTALLFSTSPFFYLHARRIADLALKHRLPALSVHREFAEAGGLVAYGADVADIYRRGGQYVAKILNGEKPADLPVEEPRKFEACNQSEDRQGARPHDPAVAPAASGSGDRIVHRRAFVTGLGAVLAAPLGAEAHRGHLMKPRNRVRLLCAFIMLRLTLVTFVSAVAPQPASTSPQDVAFDAEGKPLPGTTIPCAPIVEKRQELGCYVVGRPKLGALPMQTPLSWHLDNFPNRTSAEMAKNQYGTIVEAFDRVWLFTIAPEDWRAAGAKHVATVGPLALDPKVSEYTALYVATTFRPGLSSFVHRHPGPEAWFIVSGEQCLETPDGPIFGRAGDGVAVRADVPMIIHAIGHEVRRNFALILHDTLKAATTPVDDWKPRGLCRH